MDPAKPVVVSEPNLAPHHSLVQHVMAAAKSVFNKDSSASHVVAINVMGKEPSSLIHAGLAVESGARAKCIR